MIPFLSMPVKLNGRTQTSKNNTMSGFNHSHQNSGQGNSKGNTNAHCPHNNQTVQDKLWTWILESALSELAAQGLSICVIA
jgi:hypothetical protein